MNVDPKDRNSMALVSLYRSWDARRAGEADAERDIELFLDWARVELAAYFEIDEMRSVPITDEMRELFPDAFGRPS